MAPQLTRRLGRGPLAVGLDSLGHHVVEQIRRQAERPDASQLGKLGQQAVQAHAPGAGAQLPEHGLVRFEILDARSGLGRRADEGVEACDGRGGPDFRGKCRGNLAKCHTQN